MNQWRELKLKRQAQHRGGPFSELSVRAFNVLDGLGLDSVEAVRRATDAELLRGRSCGKVTLKEIRAWIAKQPPDDFTPGVKPDIGSPDFAIVELRNKVLAVIQRTAPRWNVSEMDMILAEFADGLLDRERDIWQKELVAARAAGDTPPRNGPGQLHVGANDKGEVVINLPGDMTGHICFTPSQARHLAVVLIRQAAAAANEPLPGGFGS